MKAGTTMDITQYLSNKLLARKTVCVTGGGSGINLGIAKNFAAVSLPSPCTHWTRSIVSRNSRMFLGSVTATSPSAAPRSVRNTSASPTMRLSPSRSASPMPSMIRLLGSGEPSSPPRIAQKHTHPEQTQQRIRPNLARKQRVFETQSNK